MKNYKRKKTSENGTMTVMERLSLIYRLGEIGFTCYAALKKITQDNARYASQKTQLLPDSSMLVSSDLISASMGSVEKSPASGREVTGPL